MDNAPATPQNTKQPDMDKSNMSNPPEGGEAGMPLPSTMAGLNKTSMVILLLVGLMIIGSIIYFMFFNTSLWTNTESSDDASSETSSISSEASVSVSSSSSSIAGDGITQIAFIAEDNVWVVNADGSNNHQITFDGDGDVVRYGAIDWREPDVVSYAKCDGTCKIFAYDIGTDTETEILESQPFTQFISAIEWSQDGDSLVYLFHKPDASMEAKLWDGTDDETVLHSYAPIPPRGGGLDDMIAARFNSNDSMIVVVNTIANPDVDPSMIAFESDGTVVNSFDLATFPTFDGDDGFYFKQDGVIKRFDFATETTATTYTFVGEAGYGFETSPDTFFIAYWSILDADGSASLNYYDTGGSPSMIEPGFMYPQWLSSSDTLVAIQAGEADAFGTGYLPDGMYTVDRLSGDSAVLDEREITVFEVED